MAGLDRARALARLGHPSKNDAGRPWIFNRGRLARKILASSSSAARRVVATDKAFVPQLFVDAGVGRELTAWDRGTVGRELVFIGIESRQGFDIPQGGAIHGVSWMGMPMGLRLQLAPAIDSLTIARACSQCGTPPPAHTDLAILFYYGLEFGR